MSDGIHDSNKPKSTPIGFPISKRVTDEIKDRFSYHPPAEDQKLLYQVINQTFMDCATKVAAVCGGLDHSEQIRTAFHHLASARMWANAHIAINNVGVRDVPKTNG